MLSHSKTQAQDADRLGEATQVVTCQAAVYVHVRAGGHLPDPSLCPHAGRFPAPARPPAPRAPPGAVPARPRHPPRSAPQEAAV